MITTHLVQGDHVLDEGVEVVEAGRGGEHSVHDAGAEQALAKLRARDHVEVGSNHTCTRQLLGEVIGDNRSTRSGGFVDSSTSRH